MQKAVQKDVHQAIVDLQKRQDSLERQFKTVQSQLSNTIISEDRIRPYITTALSSDTTPAARGLIAQMQKAGNQINETIMNLITEKQDSFLYGRRVDNNIVYVNEGQTGDEKLKKITAQMYAAENGDVLIIEDGVCKWRFNAHTSCDFDFRIFDHELFDVHISGSSNVVLHSYENIDISGCQDVEITGKYISLVNSRNITINANNVKCENCMQCEIRHAIELFGAKGYHIAETFYQITDSGTEEFKFEAQKITQTYITQDDDGQWRVFAAMFDRTNLPNSEMVPFYAIMVGTADTPEEEEEEP